MSISSEAEIPAYSPSEYGAGDDPAVQVPDHTEHEHEIRDLESGLIDVGDVSLVQLRVADDSVLAHVLRRLIDDVSHPDDIVAGFSSTL